MFHSLKISCSTYRSPNPSAGLQATSWLGRSPSPHDCLALAPCCTSQTRFTASLLCLHGAMQCQKHPQPEWFLYFQTASQTEKERAFDSVTPDQNLHCRHSSSVAHVCQISCPQPSTESLAVTFSVDTRFTCRYSNSCWDVCAVGFSSSASTAFLVHQKNK